MMVKQIHQDVIGMSNMCIEPQMKQIKYQCSHKIQDKSGKLELPCHCRALWSEEGDGSEKI